MLVSHLQLIEIAFMAAVLLLIIKQARGFSKKEKTLKRLPYFDFAKGIAIIAVVCIHTNGLIGSQWLNLIMWFAVPVFVLESGYLLAERHEKIEWKSYLRNILTRIVLVYLIFLIILRIAEGQSLNPLAVLWDMVIGREGHPLYFIPIIIQLYLLFPFLLQLKKYIFNKWVLVLLFTYSYIISIIDYSLQSPDWNSSAISLLFFGRFLGYFVVGMYLSQYDFSKLGFRKAGTVIAAYLAGTALLTFYVGALYTTFIYPVIFFLALNAAYRLLPARMEFIEQLGRHSLIIYLVHVKFVFNYFGPYIQQVFTSQVSQYLAVASSSLLVSYVISRLFMAGYHPVIKGLEKRINKG